MKILAVSDQEAKNFYDYYTPGKLDGFDLILSCGDLKREYLEFLVTMARCPVLYVHGNHDDGFDAQPPQGCICIEDQIYNYKGVRILGLGGSYRYRDGKHMFTEKQMSRRVKKLAFRLWRSKGFDIMLTHAPAYQLGDLDTPSHRGFACFGELLEKYHPRFFVHGHVHRAYGKDVPRRMQHGETTILNADEYIVFEVEHNA